MSITQPERLRAFFLRLGRFLDRPEFAGTKLRVVLLRLWWELRWRILKDCLLTRTIDNVARFYLLPTPPCFALYATGWSERIVGEVIQAYLKPDMVVLDIGAYIGEYTIRAAQLVGEGGSVYAFEPNPTAFAVLSANIAYNDLKNVVLERFVVSDGHAEVGFENRRYPEGSALERSRRASETDSINPVISVSRLPSLSLDEYTHIRNLTHVNLIKIDVEGAELKVLRGCVRLLHLYSPTLIFEFDAKLLQTYGYSPEDLLLFLHAQGYRVTEPAMDGVRLFLKEFRFSGSPDTHLNLVAFKGDSDTAFWLHQGKPDRAFP